jgi:hypothetical protein
MLGYRVRDEFEWNATIVPRIETPCVETTVLSHAPLIPFARVGLFSRTVIAAKKA